MRVFFIFIAIALVNLLIGINHYSYLRYAFGSEFILLGIIIFVSHKQVAVFFRELFLIYPFTHYFGSKQLTARETFIKALGLLIIFIGIMVAFF